MNRCEYACSIPWCQMSGVGLATGCLYTASTMLSAKQEHGKQNRLSARKADGQCDLLIRAIKNRKAYLNSGNRAKAIQTVTGNSQSASAALRNRAKTKYEAELRKPSEAALCNSARNHRDPQNNKNIFASARQNVSKTSECSIVLSAGVSQ